MKSRLLVAAVGIPLLLVIPLLLLIGALIPVIVLQSVKKQSIVDRLREGE